MPLEGWDIVMNLGPWGFAVAVSWMLLRFILNHVTHKMDDMHETLRELVREIRNWRSNS
jgi:hypothetical protein